MTEQQNPEDLRALAARVLEMDEKATPGPWAWLQWGEKFNAWAIGVALDEDLKPREGFIKDYDDMVEEVLNHPIGDTERSNYEDAAFIALSRTAAPELARAVLALLEEVERVKRIAARRIKDHRALADAAMMDGHEASATRQYASAHALEELLEELRYEE